VERNRKAGQNPPRVVAPIEEEKGREEEEEDRRMYLKHVELRIHQ
jgi:hypothetical protein